uniref:NAD(P)-binding domain-containing protein n=1 Tax=Pyramimonas obovata TaxID=1411642 RepID=A0A7S0MX97_9CHLO|mmetsp:Transcript_15666/g.33961  ORF Transcript_15666/g.33961 Transcript_15666/m.33961 type:complete len:387 (+) Transcript_15666:113-1273(+)
MIRTMRIAAASQYFKAATQAATVGTIGGPAALEFRRSYSSDLPVNYGAVGKPGRSAVSGIQATVFGSTGFLGRYVVNEFGQIGSRVLLPTRCNDNARQHLKPMGDVGQIYFMDYDCMDKEDLAKAVAGSNIVINLIGKELPTGNFSFKDVHETVPALIAQACAEEGVSKFIHVSALGACESSPSEFYRSKAAGEAAVKAAFPSASIVRPALLVGWEDSFFNRIAQGSKYLPFFPLVDGGQTKYQPVYCPDVALAIKTIALSEESGLTYELAGPKVYTFKECVDLVFEVIRERKPSLMVPSFLAKLAVSPMDYMQSKLPFPWSMPVAGGSWTVDAVESMASDYVASGNYPGFDHLGITPSKLEGLNIDYLRAYRAGGYDFGKEASEI